VHSLQNFVRGRLTRTSKTCALIDRAGASVDADDTEVAVERMTEEELLKGSEPRASRSSLERPSERAFHPASCMPKPPLFTTGPEGSPAFAFLICS